MSERVPSVVQSLRSAHRAVAEPCASIPQHPPLSDASGHEKDAPGDGGGRAQPELSPKQNLALEHLLLGRSYTETARLVGVDRSTLYEWRKNPAFLARLRELSREALEAVAMRTRRMLLRGSDRLDQLLDRSSFADTLRIVSSKRLWDVASLMPDGEELGTSH